MFTFPPDSDLAVLETMVRKYGDSWEINPYDPVDGSWSAHQQVPPYRILEAPTGQELAEELRNFIDQGFA